MSKVKPFFEHTCHKCGLVEEANFVWAGPHIKQICNGCSSYVKFFDKNLIPDVRAIKEKIWILIDKDLEGISQCKNECEFIEGQKGIYEKMQYWKLYLYIRNA